MADKATETTGFGPVLDYLSDASNMVSVGFLAVFIVLIWKGMPILGKMLDDRASTISKQLDEVAAVKSEAEAMLAQYKEKHANAMAEADSIVDQAKADAARMAQNAEADLAASIERRKAAMEARISQMEARAKQEINRKTVESALGAARAVMADGAGSGSSLIDAAIDDLPKRLN